MSGDIEALYRTLEAFYAQRPERRRSKESDYGVHWHTPDERHPLWKLAYVQETGELYAMAQSPPHVVALVATLLPVTRDIDVILGGWEDPEITGGWNLDWVGRRVKPAGLECPSCGARAGFALAGSDDGSAGFGQAFCSNDDCRMFSWEPGKTRAEIINEMTEVHLPSWTGEAGRRADS